MPRSGESPRELLSGAIPLAGTPGQEYVERRGIPAAVAHAAGVRFAADFGGRPAVIAALHNDAGEIVSVHGRYLHLRRGENKMLTIGPGGGTLNVFEGWKADPLILVEGLFDALSLGVCGFSSAATIGRWAEWLPDIVSKRDVWLAFDRTRSGEADVLTYRDRLRGARAHRLPPPPLCKDWNTALVKRGAHVVTRWLRESLTHYE